MTDKILVEQTSKTYKAMTLVGGLLFVGGGILGLSTPAACGPAALLGIAGLIVCLVSSALSWWNHG